MFIDISTTDWAFAALLGEARRRSNDSIRNGKRDRGNEKNIHVDLMGSISEILAMKYLRGVLTQQERNDTIRGMFRPEGGGGKLGADLRISQRKLSLDVKTFDCEDNKRYFAINGSKHKDLSGDCDGYLCVICPKYSSRAFIVDYVPYADVSGWNSKALGNYGDSSFNLSITDFLATYSESIKLNDIKQSVKYPKELIGAEIRNPENRVKFYNVFPDSERFVTVANKKVA